MLQQERTMTIRCFCAGLVTCVVLIAVPGDGALLGVYKTIVIDANKKLSAFIYVVRWQINGLRIKRYENTCYRRNRIYW